VVVEEERGGGERERRERERERERERRERRKRRGKAQLKVRRHDVTRTVLGTGCAAHRASCVKGRAVGTKRLQR